MIVDSHAYCFTAPDTLAGHATVAEHTALWQWGYALHHQPAFGDEQPARPYRLRSGQRSIVGQARIVDAGDFNHHRGEV